MINFPAILGPDGRRLVQQKLIHPAVYLDTWAIRLFADNVVMGDRFRAALLNANGTLVLSDLNIGDFTSFDDARHARAAGQFVDSLGANLFFSAFSPFPVIEREIATMVRQTDQSPAGDVEMLRLYAEAADLQRRRPSVLDWFVDVHHNRNELKPRLVGMAQAFLIGLDQLRQRFDAEPGFKKSAFRDVENSHRPRSTQALLRAIIFRLEGDRQLKLSVNDAIDIMHCVVPAAYCDYVLVDHTWSVRLAAARAWLDKAGIESHIAQVFAGRRNGVQRFLEHLEG